MPKTTTKEVTVNIKHDGGQSSNGHTVTHDQYQALMDLASRFNTELDWSQASVGGHGLPADWVQCQVGPIVVGVSPDGDVHS